MIKDGEGGSHTKTGLIFENKSDIRKLFKNSNKYELVEHQDEYFILSQNSKEIAVIAKRKQYQKLVSSLDWSVNYIYILNDWFKKREYKDTLDYIKTSGCKYYFNKLDLTEIGL